MAEQRKGRKRDRRKPQWRMTLENDIGIYPSWVMGYLSI